LNNPSSIAQGYEPMGYIRSEQTFDFQAPSITPGTLRINGTDPETVDGISTVLTLGTESITWLRFDAQNLGFGGITKISITYVNSDVNNYVCSATADSGFANNDGVLCSTAIGNVPGTYTMRVAVGNYVAEGIDQLIVPTTPILTSVIGCQNNAETGYPVDCPTGGGVSLTLVGEHFGLGVYVHVDGRQV